MVAMFRFISQVVRFAFRLVLGLFAAIFAVSLLSAALLLLSVGLLKSLITGQKAKPLVFGRFQRFTAQAPWSGNAMRGAGAPPAAEVVDVEVREIRNNKHLP